ncbi:lantibiotic dehydratase [Hymenobacter persicinus]|uniref:Lantibiotic dehydratase n=1 Tax=Hymenobacter persicinus TaxID=2025506 RepID=A0A4Q5L8X6_9BACT|nr:lantibiotic dehydratase [Hymenobacter persicinus]RYU77918.1 hypothetical protein EWM57_16030 [Hymenobacter persicinus]
MQPSYSFHPALVVRTPALPFAPQFTVADIRRRLADPAFAEALYLASPELHAESRKWQHGTRPAEPRREEKLLYSLSRYYLRMSSRCTPFGLFASCSVAHWGAADRLVRPAGPGRRHTRLDMHYLCGLAQHLAAQPDVRERLLYSPNSSFYEIGHEIRYVELRAEPTGQLVHQISSVAASDYLTSVLAVGETGATREQLAAPLLAAAIPPDEALAFIDELIAEQILVSELEPTVTGPEFLPHLLAVLRRLQARQPSATIAATEATLQEVSAALTNLDAADSEQLAGYPPIQALLHSLGAPWEPGRVFQTDLVHDYAGPGQVSEDWQGAIREGVEALTYLAAPARQPRLEQFQALFVARYEDREVPLLEALDGESGLAYSSFGKSSFGALVQDLVLDQPAPDRTLSQSPVQQLLYQKLREADRRGAYAVELTKAELTDFAPLPALLPPSFSVMFRPGEAGQVVLESVGGSSAANLLGRFAHADAKIEAVVRDITAQEQAQNPAVVLAEICHLPVSRVGNILLRPCLRPYEIPYLAQSAVDAEHQVRVRDLVVAVRGGRLVLRCRRTNRQIIPRLSSAHNYSAQALPVYQFLCDLQTQGLQASLRFSWSQVAFAAKFFPRLTYGRAILQVAAWHLEAADWQALAGLSEAELAPRFAAFRAQWQLPRYFTLADGDNELLVDADNLLTVQVWLDTIRTRPSIRLREFFFDPAHSLLQDEQGRPYVGQFVASLLRSTSCYVPAPVTTTDHERPAVQREFALGSEWLYLKWYCGPQAANRILVEVLQPLTDELRGRQLIDQWFFIRYADPDSHLRVRLHLPAPDRIGEVIAMVQAHVQPYVKHGYIWKTQTDTYRRELERYGHRTMAASEALFCADSHAVVRLLTHTGPGNSADHWLYGTRWVNQLLDAFSYTIEQKTALLLRLRDSFTQEFGGGKTLRLQLDAKYRQHRAALTRALAAQPPALPAESAAGLDYHGMPAVRAVAQLVGELEQAGRLEVRRDALLSSYVHMLLNRVVAVQPRLHELLIYDFLHRHYHSQQQRQAAATSGRS